ncbi:hypothetical protein [Leptospira yanagawae]|nr:hypothetical protein [Leptospira yanagawae]
MCNRLFAGKETIATILSISKSILGFAVLPVRVLAKKWESGEKDQNIEI